MPRLLRRRNKAPLTAALPHARVAYPPRLTDRCKYYFWRAYAPAHPLIRDTAVTLGLVRHTGRQRYLLGTIAPHLSLESFLELLVAKGYGNHFVAWKEEGEVASMRLATDFVYQYHIRVYEDREVRGHYEYTPECYPAAHLREEGLEGRREYFEDLLQGAVTFVERAEL